MIDSENDPDASRILVLLQTKVTSKSIKGRISRCSFPLFKVKKTAIRTKANEDVKRKLVSSSEKQKRKISGFTSYVSRYRSDTVTMKQDEVIFIQISENFI